MQDLKTLSGLKWFVAGTGASTALLKQTLSVSCSTADPPLSSTVAVVTLSAEVHFHVTNPQFTRASVASSATHGAQLFP